MITVLLQKIIDLLSEHFPSVITLLSKLNLIEEDTEEMRGNLASMKTTLEDVDTQATAAAGKLATIDTTLTAAAGNVAAIKSNSDAIKNNIITMSTNVGNVAAYTQNTANNTLDIDQKITSIASDTTDIRTSNDNIYSESSKIYDAVKWLLSDKDMEETETADNSVSFNTDYTEDLVKLVVELMATQSGTGNPTPDNIRPISGYSNITLTVNGQNVSIALGQTVYSGVFDVLSGKLLINMVKDTMSSSYLSGLSSSYIGLVSSTPYFGGHPSIWVRNWKTPPACKGRISGGIRSMCNAFPISMNNSDIISTQYRIYFDVYNLNISSVSDFISIIQTMEINNPLEIIYELETPTEIVLTPSQIATIKGLNTISTDTNGEITVTYKESIKHYLDKND